MKTLLSLFLLLALGASAATGIKISEYPNTPVLTNSELFIVAVTNVTPATNRNITYGQLRSLLASNNFVGSFTGDGRNVSNVVASYVSGTLSNNINGNAATATNWTGAIITNWNTAIGQNAGQGLTTNGTENTFYGFNAGQGITSGTLNTAVGAKALENGITTADNTALGAHALRYNTRSNNLAIGSQAMGYADGSFNIAIGTGALHQDVVNHVGDGNVVIGYDAMYFTGNSSRNTVIGSLAGLYDLGGLRDFEDSVYIGYKAGYNNAQSNHLAIANVNGDLLWGTFSATPANATLECFGPFTATSQVYLRNLAKTKTWNFNHYTDDNLYLGNSTLGYGFIFTSDFREMIGTTTDSGATLTVVGHGTTLATSALAVRDSSNADMLRVLDNGNTAFGGTNAPERVTVSGNISASGSMIATNAFVMPPVSAGPDWCTNGLAAIWNSNTTVYIRTSAVGATTYADKLMAP